MNWSITISTKLAVKSKLHLLPLIAIALVAAAFAIKVVFFSNAGGAVVCDKVASRTGSDSNAGTEASPYKSAQKVADNLTAGQTGCLHAGVYTELANGGYVLRPLHGGTSTTSQIIIRSYPNDPSGRATLQGPIDIQLNSNFVTLSDLNLDGSTYGSNSMEVYASNFSLLRNDITNKHLGGSCIYLGSDGSYPQTGPATNVLIKDNIIHECGKPANGNQDHSIYAHSPRGGQITENIFYDPTGFQIQFWTDSQGLQIDHNIFNGGSVVGGIVFGGGDNLLSNNNSVNNNIITNAAQKGITYCWAGSAAANCAAGPSGIGNVANNNCLYGNIGGDISAQIGFTASGNLTSTNPLYVNSASHDFTLQTGSPCLAKTGYDIAVAVNAAIAAAGLSGGSNSLPPAAPTGLTATASPGQVVLNWTVSPIDEAVTRYNIYRLDTAGVWGYTANGTTTTFTNASGITNGTQYCYTINAVNSAGPSPQSTQACATPMATTKIGDLNGDNSVNIFDLSILLTNFGKTPAQSTNPAADLNANNFIDIYDLSILLSHYGT